MKSRLKFILLIGLALGHISAPGCSNTETAVSDNAQMKSTPSGEGSEQAGVAGDSVAEEKDSKHDPVGEWKIDATETIKANSALLRTPGFDANGFKASIRGMISDFLIEPDSTFFCYEKVGNTEADYSGTWELKGNRIGLYQKTQDDREKEDELVGTIDGDRMDLVHKQQGLSVKMVLVR